MFGKLLSLSIKAATLPIDAANATMDILCGGNGSEKSRNDYDSPLSALEKLRNSVAKAVEEIDD